MPHRAQQIYQERFPGRRIIHHSTIAQVFQLLKETSLADVCRPDAECKRSVCTTEMEENILFCVEQNLLTSTRAVAVGAAHSTVSEVLHEQLLNPYKRQKVQSLNPVDFSHRQEFV